MHIPACSKYVPLCKPLSKRYVLLNYWLLKTKPVYILRYCKQQMKFELYVPIYNKVLYRL